MLKCIQVYKVELKIDGKTQSQEGKTVLEALEKLIPTKDELYRVFLKSKRLLTVSSGKKDTQLILYPVLIKRLAVNKNYRLILDKRFPQALQ